MKTVTKDKFKMLDSEEFKSSKPFVMFQVQNVCFKKFKSRKTVKNFKLLITVANFLNLNLENTLQKVSFEANAL